MLTIAKTEIEDDGQNEEHRDFVYGNYLDEVLIMIVDDGQNQTDHYYDHDHLFSPVALIADDGTVEERYEYDAYGRMTRLDPDFTAWSGTPAGNPYYFTGQRLDELDNGNLLIMYYKNRYYLVDLGRFIQRDPIRYRDGMNPYEYVRSRPIVALDELGLFTFEFLNKPMFHAPMGHHFDFETRCLDEVWMAIAVFPTAEEKEALVKAGGGTAVMRKYTRWQYKNCRDGKTIGEDSNASTFIRTLGIAGSDIRNDNSGGAGGVGIVNRNKPKGGTRMSVFYSLLMYQGFPQRSKCCSEGSIDVVARILLFAGESPFNIGSRNPASKHGTDGNHMPNRIPGWRNGGSKILPIASGYIAANVSWDCSQKVKGTFISDVEYNGAGGYNNRMDDRTGLAQRDDWMDFNEREGWFNIPVNTK